MRIAGKERFMPVPQQHSAPTAVSVPVRITPADVREVGSGRSRLIAVKAEEEADEGEAEEQSLR